MRRFNFNVLKDKKWDNEIVNYLSLIHEAKGKQSLYLKQKPYELNKLVEIAKIQSTESSNLIEGIRTTETRLRQLMSEKTMPRNRDEKEIAGYRDALNIVQENFEYGSSAFLQCRWAKHRGSNLKTARQVFHRLQSL